MRGILRSLPSQPTINSSARIGNRFIPRPDELVSYGGGCFDVDRPYQLMTAKPGADGVLNAPVFHGRQFPDYGKRPGQCGEWGLWPGSTPNSTQRMGIQICMVVFRLEPMPEGASV